jgi:DNA-binding MarR family transcriptional regulator
MDNVEHLIVPIWQAFVWLDEGLQNYLRLRGWPEVTRPQSMVMTNVVAGVTRPSDIARNLGVSRQAIHVTIRHMIALGMLELVDDPHDRRSKIVAIAPTGALMRQSAQEAMRLLSLRLRQRIGDGCVDALQAALGADWGAALTWSDADFAAIHATRPDPISPSG